MRLRPLLLVEEAAGGRRGWSRRREGCRGAETTGAGQLRGGGGGIAARTLVFSPRPVYGCPLALQI
jgi:hypothetical protein